MIALVCAGEKRRERGEKLGGCSLEQRAESLNPFCALVCAVLQQTLPQHQLRLPREPPPRKLRAVGSHCTLADPRPVTTARDLPRKLQTRNKQPIFVR